MNKLILGLKTFCLLLGLGFANMSNAVTMHIDSPTPLKEVHLQICDNQAPAQHHMISSTVTNNSVNINFEGTIECATGTNGTDYFLMAPGAVKITSNGIIPLFTKSMIYLCRTSCGGPL